MFTQSWSANEAFSPGQTRFHPPFLNFGWINDPHALICFARNKGAASIGQWALYPRHEGLGKVHPVLLSKRAFLIRPSQVKSAFPCQVPSSDRLLIHRHRSLLQGARTLYPLDSGLYPRHDGLGNVHPVLVSKGGLFIRPSQVPGVKCPVWVD